LQPLPKVIKTGGNHNCCVISKKFTFSSTIVETDLKTLFSELHHLLLTILCFHLALETLFVAIIPKLLKLYQKVSKVFETHFNGFQNLKNFSQ